MEYSLAIYFIYFIIIAMLGWLMEVSLRLIQKHQFSNRGFLIGPYCPIYGCGALIITFCLTGLKEHPIALFGMAIFICGILEYSTSYIMEKLFHARWWDYSENTYNINGRICLETIVPFGILGLMLIYFINPLIFDNLAKISENVLNVVASIIAVIFVVDNIISFKVISNVRSITTKFDKENPKDNTDEISQKVKEFLRSKSILNRRLVNAFPKLTAILKEQSEIIKQKTNDVKEEITQKTEKVKENMKKSLDDTTKKVKNVTQKEKDDE